MADSVLQATLDADVLIMAAAVADFRPKAIASQKIKKERGMPVIELEPTPDILQAISQRKIKTGFPHHVVGFAAESQDLIENAFHKLQKKSLDLIVANDISQAETGFEVDQNKVSFLFADGRIESLPALSKSDVGEKIMEKVIGWF